MERSRAGSKGKAVSLADALVVLGENARQAEKRRAKILQERVKLQEKRLDLTMKELELRRLEAEERLLVLKSKFEVSGKEYVI